MHPCVGDQHLPVGRYPVEQVDEQLARASRGNQPGTLADYRQDGNLVNVDAQERTWPDDASGDRSRDATLFHSLPGRTWRCHCGQVRGRGGAERKRGGAPKPPAAT
jgi:hypothetical protein